MDEDVILSIDTVNVTSQPGIDLSAWLKPGSETLLADVEAELGCKLENVNWHPGFFAIASQIQIARSKVYCAGKIYGIDAASGAAVTALNVLPGDHILDLCAAPGKVGDGNTWSQRERARERERNNGEEEERQKERGDGVVVVEPKLKAGFLSCLLDAVEDLDVRIATSKSKQQRQFFLTDKYMTAMERLSTDCLNGEFVRVGPNAKFAPLAYYHWFDGDGYTGYVPSTLSYRIRSSRHFEDSCERATDVLKVLEDGDLQTLGLMDYDRRLEHSFTAHPKVDPFTGEMFTFGYSTTSPYYYLSSYYKGRCHA
ncbi:carotenoid 9,10(9',10')-cleavage dioxygenase 1-like [Nymphaea colorata]|nr:carotenoid 9,10(9',10')-cleavage dioxygenase 1-like [Nymphaea colorata]